MQLELFHDWRMPFQRWLLNFNYQLYGRYILLGIDVYVNPVFVYKICGKEI